MTTQTLTLTDFLLARIADTEVMLASVVDTVEYHGGRLVDARELVKAEAEAKRRAVAWAAPLLTDWPGTPEGFRYVSDDGRDLLAILALPYADHPDYREDWKP